jgi:hypothetical protein
VRRPRTRATVTHRLLARPCRLSRADLAGPRGTWVTETEDGIRVTDVWQTREEFEAFAADKISPLSAEVGFPAPLEITFHDVHNYDSAEGPA